ATNSAKDVLYRCGFRYAPAMNGVDIRDVAEVYVRECAATDNFADGFGYAIDNVHSTVTQALEDRCFSARNGWDNGAGTSNGSSAHDGALIIRTGGEYAHNHGPNVVDVLGAQSVNIALNSHDGAASGASGSNYQAGQFDGVSGAIMYLKN